MKNNLPIQKHFGLRWQDFDPRDCKFSPAKSIAAAALPASSDLTITKGYPAVYDQGQLGSCTANGSGFAVEFMQIKENKTFYTPSRLFIYYNSRVIEGTVKQDAGAQIRDAIKAIAKLGAPPEKDWPYVISKFKTKPPVACFTDGLKELALSYEAVNNGNPVAVKSALASGLPVVFGATLYASFESDAVAKTGVVPMPGTHEQIVGGHCMAIVGHDDKKQLYKVRNSWGADWGKAGHCFIPYTYIHNTNLTGDCWIVKSVS